MTRQDYDELKLALERNATGAHAHTANKAEFYLYKLIDKPTARFSNCTQDEFISAVRRALGLGNWDALSTLMARWF